MRILAIETATEACSVALFEDGRLLDTRHEVLGRGHAERLVPMIAELSNKGRADEIRVSLGPGSFTGTRIGLATARALGVAWGVRVRGYPTLALVAAIARQTHPGAVTVCMTGGHGEWFVQDFNGEGKAEGELASIRPNDSAGFGRHVVIAGSQAQAKADHSGRDSIVLHLLPEARHALALPEWQMTDAVAPLYGRAPDAKLPV